MHLSEATVVCNYCWQEIGEEQVSSPTPERRIRVTFRMCSDCRVSFGYDYNEFATTFAVASFLLWQDIPERILMRDFGQYAKSLLDKIKEEDRHNLKNVVNNHRQDLVKLKELAFEVNQAYKKYQDRFPLSLILGKFAEAKDNPFKQYENYINRQIKKEHAK